MEEANVVCLFRRSILDTAPPTATDSETVLSRTKDRGSGASGLENDVCFRRSEVRQPRAFSCLCNPLQFDHFLLLRPVHKYLGLFARPLPAQIH